MAVFWCLQNAFKSYVRMRDYCATSKQIIAMCLAVIKASTLQCHLRCNLTFDPHNTVGSCCTCPSLFSAASTCTEIVCPTLAQSLAAECS